MKERWPDLATLVLAIVLASIGRAASFAGLLLAYLVAWAIVNVARVRGLPREPITTSPWVIGVGVLVVIAAPLADLARRAHALVEAEGLLAPIEHLADRLALEADPAIAPPIVPGDRPLTYFVRASGERVRVRFTGDHDPVEAESLGHGVFRVDYDPRVHGAPPPDVHEVQVAIDVDGAISLRTLAAETPLAHPRWARTSPDRTRACVPSEETDEVIVVGAAHDARITTLDGPTDCLVDDDGTQVISHRYDDALLFLRGEERSRVSIGHRGAVSLARAGALLLALVDDAAPSLLVLDASTGAARASLSLEGHPLFVVADDARAFVATRGPAQLLAVALAPAPHVVARRRLTTPAVHLALAGDGTVQVALTDYVEDGTPHLGNHYVEDRIARFDPSLALVSDERTAWRSPRQDHAGDVDRGASPMGISFTPRDTRWIAFAGTDEIEEVGGTLAEPRVIDTAPLGLSAPFSVVELANGDLVATSPSSGRVAVLAPDGTLLRATSLAPDDRALLHDDPTALQLRFGERAFYEATRSGISCQSCHLHGGTDDATHNIGGHLAAPTLDVHGLAGTSPYLRDGSYPRLSDLHEVAVTELRGFRTRAGDRGATLEAWMRSLPPAPTFVARDADAERRGLDVFVRAGCTDCHPAPAFTSLGLHPIDAVFPDAPRRREGRVLDVPSLRGVSASAPYLYDGRAPTLRALFTDHNRSDRHGHTAVLDDGERAALEAFLRSL